MRKLWGRTVISQSNEEVQKNKGQHLSLLQWICVIPRRTTCMKLSISVPSAEPKRTCSAGRW